MSIALESIDVILNDRYPYDLTDQDKASFEKTLNVLGYFPLLSTGTGPFRLIVGIGTIIASAVKAPLCLIADQFQRRPYSSSHRCYKHLTYIAHGLANVIRGFIEAWPFIGNLLTICYDTFITRISYPVESTGVHYQHVSRKPHFDSN